MTTAEYWLTENFRELGLPPDAAAWLLDLWHVTQTFDDVADGDPVDRAALDDVGLRRPAALHLAIMRIVWRWAWRKGPQN